MNHVAEDPQSSFSGAPLPLRSPFTRWPRGADAVLAFVVFLIIVFLIPEEASDDLTMRSLSDVSIGELLIAVLASGVLYWRRSHSLVVLGVALLAIALSTGFDYSELIGVSMMVALYSVGRYITNDQVSYNGVGVSLVLAAIHSYVHGETAIGIGFGLVFVYLTWYIGRRFRIRGDYVRLLQERANRLEQDQADEARRAVAEERTRIARELHDIVAHRVSLMTVQAGAAKTVAADDPEAALRAMEAVEKVGRQALDELRHLMGILRPEAEVDGLGPQPGLADVSRLVEHLKEAGLAVSLTMDVVSSDLPTRVDLSAYRIVQEALTNVLKHAGPGTRTEVRLSTDNQGIVIEVFDSGHGTTTLPGSGHGIIGMRERALLLGGSLNAGPRPGGGFQVLAHLPIGEEPI